jgi:polysaccharide export outer membrane protein
MKLDRLLLLAIPLLIGISACSTPQLPPSALNSALKDAQGNYMYRIGTNDVLSVFVWNNQDISGDYPVAPDGKISMSLSGDQPVAGLSTQEVEQKLTEALSQYIKNPRVTVQVKNASGSVLERVRLIGDAVTPSSQPYRHGLTLLDLMISVGGLSPYADGNSAELMRVENGKVVRYRLRLKDLMENADLTANIDLLPGDIIQIPESWF